MKRLFAAEERASKLSRLGDPLESPLGRHVDFAALAASVDRAHCRGRIVTLVADRRIRPS